MKKLFKFILVLFLFTRITVYAEEAMTIEEYESEEIEDTSGEKEEEELLDSQCTVNEDFLYWLELPEEEQKKYIMPEYCVQDEYEEDLDEYYETNKATTYPSYYLKPSTAVKDQKQTGTCWAHAATTVLESYMLNKKNSNYLLSPGHMNYMESQSFYNVTNKHGTVRWVNDGGSFNSSMTYWIKRYGPVLESTVPTNTDVSELPPVEYNTIWGKKNVIDVNNVQYSYRSLGACTAKEKNRIKGTITNFGPVGVYLHLLQDKVNTSYNSYIYKTSKKNLNINHAVVIVGWDDNYPASRFGGKAKNNGAWIVQNSWGTYYGDNGLYYVSYEDDTICTTLLSVRSADTNFSDNKYITSERPYDTWTNLSTTEMSVFNKKDNGVAEKLNKVSFETLKSTKYKVYYYKGNAAKKKVSTKKMKLIASGTAAYSGWITIKPNKTVIIPKGIKQYSIVVVLSSKKIALTKSVTWAKANNGSNKNKLYKSPDTFKKGQSYIYYRGRWKDLYSFFANYKHKATINAFTDNITLDVTKTSVGYYKEDYLDVFFDVKANYNTKITKVDVVRGSNIVYTTGDIEESLNKGDKKNYYVRINGLTGFVNGKHTVKVYLSNGTVRTRDVNIKVIPISGVKITNKEGLKLGVGKTLQMTYTLTPSNFNSINPTITWTTSNSSIATVDANGVVTGVNVGNVTITATTMNGKTASYDLIIDRPIESIGVSPTSITLDPGETYTPSARVVPYNTTDDKTLLWYATNYRALVYSDTGLITAYKPGYSQICVKAVKDVNNCIDVYVSGVSLKEDDITLELGDTYDSEPLVVTKNQTVSQTVTLVSSNPNVVSVLDNRILVANSLGTATITVYDTYGRSNVSNVTVTKISASRFTTSSVSIKTYNGKSIKPGVSVSFNGKTLRKGIDYTISYKNNKNPGKATISINATSKSIYEGSKKINFIIKPKGVTISKLSTGSKYVKVTYKKHPGVSGYQVSYRVKGSSTWKSIFVKGTSKKITKLTKNKKYQVKVRAYKTIDGTKYYGAWSKTKTIKCK